MTNISLLVFLLLLQGLHAATVKEKKTGKDVHHFPGSDKDLPKSVLSSKTGKLIKSTGVLLVVRAGQKLGDCKAACRDEFLINCKFYRYMEERKSCLLMTSKGLNGTPKAKSEEKQDDPKKENEKGKKAESDKKIVGKGQ
ncbi:uncharacterized protein LOC124289802 [Haliotis rubra]|uniref:uncharacterized protein LOC124289802 n=1 Tax=Haliotis rubra TaxID=36100 RepID=UPI001EE57402|nr:uncharacterized protein LOC124289802 [Haliotis rubra]